MAKSSRNKTITIDSLDIDSLYKNVITIDSNVLEIDSVVDKTIQGDTLEVLKYLPDNSVDLFVIDPPYNLSKKFSNTNFNRKKDIEYAEWLDMWLPEVKRVCKSNATVYICCDWKTSPILYSVFTKYFDLINRITWEREKWRGAKDNWKNSIEDIYFGVMNKENYFFNLEKVKVKRKVIAPYRNEEGQAKDWLEEEGWNYRLTCPNNVWTDLTVPFWSMPENTSHPTQKPEKLIAKLILASSKEWDIVCDCFLWSGTTSVVAKKLKRRYIGIEKEKEYVVITEERLRRAETDKTIQWYEEGIFWERNTLQERKKKN